MDKVIIVLADLKVQQEENDELLELVQACNMEVDIVFSQALKAISFRTYIGSGKCIEIQEYILENEVDYVIFNHDLSPLQIRNLDEVFGIPVIDRTELILKIFEQRAITRIARLQVESAQLKKLLPRLIGSNAQLGRQGSGKNKGTGEKQLEIDRRKIKARIHEVKNELKSVEAERTTQRRARQKSNLPLVALVGYTNAGKSTIMNRILSQSNRSEDKLVLEKDMLFATLDTSIRNIELPYGKSFLLSDTVGFVSNLPHSLVQAFHSTLEEVKYADMLLQVVDASSLEYDKHMRVTQETLKEIGASHIPMLTIFNKCDKTDFDYPKAKDAELYICANDTSNIDQLISFVNQHLHPDEKEYTLLLPYEKASILSILITNAQIITREDTDEGIKIRAILSEVYANKYKEYVH